MKKLIISVVMVLAVAASAYALLPAVVMDEHGTPVQGFATNPRNTQNALITDGNSHTYSQKKNLAWRADNNGPDCVYRIMSTATKAGPKWTLPSGGSRGEVNSNAVSVNPTTHVVTQRPVYVNISGCTNTDYHVHGL